MTPKRNKQLIDQVFEAWSQGDIRPLVDAMSEQCRWVFPGSWSWSGVWQPKSVVVDELLRGQLGAQFAERFECHRDFILADEDRVVVQARGRTRTVRGEVYHNTYCLIFRIHGQEVVEVIEHCDTSLVDRVLQPPATGTPGWTRDDPLP